MKNKKIIHNIALAMAIATVGSISMSTLVSAKTLDNHNQAKIEITSSKNVEVDNLKNNLISENLINKATPFVKTSENGFYLSKAGYSSLNSNEIKIVNQYINDSNNTLKDISKNENLTKKGDKFILSIKDNSNLLRSAYSDSLGYANVQYFWWGAQIYFSHQAIADLNDFFTGYGLASGMAGSAVGEFLAKHGVKISTKYLGPISLYGTGVAWAMSKLDKGDGVFLNCILYVPCTLTTP